MRFVRKDLFTRTSWWLIDKLIQKLSPLAASSIVVTLPKKKVTQKNMQEVKMLAKSTIQSVVMRRR